MRLILLGPPASGKGTQAKLLSQRLGLRHIATGDILREAIRQGTPAGQRAAPYVTSGQLVPDDLVNDIVRELFTGEQRPDRFVMDGYPRTPAQADAFDQVLRQQGLPLDAVVQLIVDQDEIVRRVSGRRTCPKCQAPYHVTSKPPRQPGVCDNDGTPLVQRDDDREDTVRRRLQLYDQNSSALVAHYDARGLLRRVEGQGNVETIYNAIVKVLPVPEGPACPAPG
jgi:adenylate kinase